MRIILYNFRWDQVINKDIESFYKKALINYKIKVSELKDCMEQDELIKNLYVKITKLYKELRFLSMAIYNKCEQLNPEIISNVSYNHVYGKSRRSLEDEFTKEESNIIDRNLANCRKYLLIYE